MIPKKRPQTTHDPKRKAKLDAFDRLLTIMDELRENCPWDKKQTFASLRNLTIEEAYELSDALLANDMDEVKKELGDLLLHLVFYSRLGQESGLFDIADVIEQLEEKLIRRHPHIYDDTEANDEETVKANWEKIKLKEGENRSVLSGVPSSLPALIKALRIQEKARGVGFDWPEKKGVWQKVEEELQEFKEASDRDKPHEYGDLLFSLINYARFENIDPEDALERTNRKFIKRFQYIEKEAAATGRQIDELSLEEMDVHWEKAKQL